MLRLVVMVIRVLFYIPIWLFHFHILQNKEKYTIEERYNYIYRFVGVLVRNLNVTITTSGYDNLPEKDGYVLTPNHQGLFDSLAIVYTHKRPVTAIVKQELMKVPVIKQIIIILDAKPMDRRNLRSSMKVIKATSREVESGRNYAIFPEGTRSKVENVVGEFKSGSFKIAIDVKAPIVPVALINCASVLDKNSLKKIHTEIHYLDPIYYEDYQDMNTTEIAALAQAKVEEKIKERLEIIETK